MDSFGFIDFAVARRLVRNDWHDDSPVIRKAILGLGCEGDPLLVRLWFKFYALRLFGIGGVTSCQVEQVDETVKPGDGRGEQ